MCSTGTVCNLDSGTAWQNPFRLYGWEMRRLGATGYGQSIITTDYTAKQITMPTVNWTAGHVKSALTHPNVAQHQLVMRCRKSWISNAKTADVIETQQSAQFETNDNSTSKIGDSEHAEGLHTAAANHELQLWSGGWYDSIVRPRQKYAGLLWRQRHKVVLAAKAQIRRLVLAEKHRYAGFCWQPRHKHPGQ